MALLAIAARGCSCQREGPAAEDSAAPPDDAAVGADDAGARPDDAGVDAGPSRCGAHPATPATAYVAQVQYDRFFDDRPLLPGETYEGGARRVFVDAGGLAVFAPRSFVYRVDLDGTVLGRVLYPEIGGQLGFPLWFAQGDDGYGGVFEFVVGGEGTYRFCPIAADGTSDPDACTGDLHQNSHLAWDGSFYRATWTGSFPDDVLRIHSFGQNGDDQGATDIADPPLNPIGAFIEAAGSSPVVLTGSARQVWLDVLDASLARQVPGPTPQLPEPHANIDSVATAPGGAHAGVLMVGGCDPDPDSVLPHGYELASFITIIDEGGGTRVPVTRVPLTVPPRGSPMVWDGERYVVLHSTDGLEMSWFGADGTWLAHRVPLPLDYVNPGHGLLASNLDFAAVAPNDYVIVYDMSQPWGVETWIARFSLAPAEPDAP